MDALTIAEFMAERFKPNGVSMDDIYDYRPVGNGLFMVNKTWRQHLIEQYLEDAQAFLLLLESNRLEISPKPLE